MTPLPRARRLRPAVLLRPGFALLVAAVAAAACTSDAEAPPRAARPAGVQPADPRPEAPQRTDTRPAPRAADRPPETRPDRSQTVFDTVEVAEAPTAPPTREAPRAEPEPLAPPTAPRAPRDAAVAGSCDVRPAEGYCFAYTGPAWTPADADAHCAAAPGATFRAAPCPAAGRVATCTFRRPSDPSREIVYTTYAPANLDLARLACPGTFAVVE